MKTIGRTLLAGALLLLLAGPARAQGRAGPSQEELVKRRAAKVAEDWFVKAGWIDDYDEARARAKEAGKLIFGYFTRSYST